MDDISWLQTIATVGATIAAIAAIMIGYYQFKKQQDDADRIAHANIKPLLARDIYSYGDCKSVILSNLGLGTAIITDAKFYIGKEEDGNTSLSLDKFIKLPNDVGFDDCYTFANDVNYVRAGDEIILGKITHDYLKERQFDETTIEEILNSWANQVSGIRLKIAYTDVLSKEQECLDKDLIFKNI